MIRQEHNLINFGDALWWMLNDWREISIVGMKLQVLQKNLPIMLEFFLKKIDGKMLIPFTVAKYLGPKASLTICNCVNNCVMRMLTTINFNFCFQSQFILFSLHKTLIPFLQSVTIVYLSLPLNTSSRTIFILLVHF